MSSRFGAQRATGRSGLFRSSNLLRASERKTCSVSELSYGISTHPPNHPRVLMSELKYFIVKISRRRRPMGVSAHVSGGILLRHQRRPYHGGGSGQVQLHQGGEAHTWRRSGAGVGLGVRVRVGVGVGARVRVRAKARALRLLHLLHLLVVHLLLNTYYAHYSTLTTLTTLTTLADLGIVHRASEAVAAWPIREERHVDRRVAEGRPAHLASRR